MKNAIEQIEDWLRDIIKEEITAAMTRIEWNHQDTVVEASEELKNLKETAAYIGVSHVTVHRWMKSKKIGYYRVGRRVLFSTEEHINPFLSGNEERPR